MMVRRGASTTDHDSAMSYAAMRLYILRLFSQTGRIRDQSGHAPNARKLEKDVRRVIHARDV